MSRESAQSIIGALSGVTRPTRALARELGFLGVRHMSPANQIEALMNHHFAVDTFANLLTRTIERRRNANGYCDMRDVAADVLAELGAHQR